jgi:hypothetical protein
VEEVKLRSFLTSVLDDVEWSTSRPDLFTPGTLKHVKHHSVLSLKTFFIKYLVQAEFSGQNTALRSSN